MKNRRRFALSALGIAGAGALSSAAEPSGRNPGIFDVTAFGATASGAALDTASIQRAIDTCSRSGGGIVLFPPGTYLSGTLGLKTGAHLHLMPGATLLGSRNLADFPEHIPSARSYTDNYTRRSLIYAENQQDIGIEGGGVLNGQGAAFSGPYLVRPYMIRMIGCRGVRVTDVTIRDSPMWVQHYLLCEDLNFDGLIVRSQVNRNNDGIDIDSCRRVRISNCDFNSEDDAIVLKSTTATPCRDIAITNCVVSSLCNAIKLGTESNGGFENISVSNCTIYDTHLAGIALECVDGGTLDRVNVNNIVMHGVQCPIFLRLGDRARVFEEGQSRPPVGWFRNVVISGVQATSAGKNACSITGLPDRPLENVLLSNINLEFLGGGTREQTSRQIPEEREHYPEHSMYGILPAYGFYVRHAREVTFDNVRVSTHKPDLRHAVVFSDVQGMTLRNLTARAEAEAVSVIGMENVREALLTGCRAPKHASTFLKVTGRQSTDVSLAGNDLSGAKTALDVDPSLPKSAVEIL